MNANPIPLSLYVHIPWCVRKCPYCDFNSHQVGSQPLPEQEYLAMLVADLNHMRDLADNRLLGSVFFGGGTPSLFSAQTIGSILDAANQIIGLHAECEITLEANPGTAEQKRFKDYRQAGVNRLSMGVQSFSDEALQRLGRIHSAEEARKAFKMARAAGFDNINLDLMFGLPGQQQRDAHSDLHQALELGPEHLSWYELTIEPNTAFYNAPPELPDDDLVAEINDTGFAHLQDAGYHRYEISAFSKSQRQSNHNLNYWQFGDYLGIGAGAHGKLTDTGQNKILRTQRTRVPEHYLNTSCAKGFKIHPVESTELPLEFLMNNLRLIDGVPKSYFLERTFIDSAEIDNIILTLKKRGYLDTTEDRIKPSALGLRFLNQCLAELMPDGDATEHFGSGIDKISALQLKN